MQEGKRRGRRGYSDDVRQRAVAKLASGATLRETSEELKISIPTLIKWHKEVDHGSSTTEIQRLREEIERLKEERNRLRRSIAVLIGQKITD